MNTNTKIIFIIAVIALALIYLSKSKNQKTTGEKTSGGGGSSQGGNDNNDSSSESSQNENDDEEGDEENESDEDDDLNGDDETVNLQDPRIPLITGNDPFDQYVRSAQLSKIVQASRQSNEMEIRNPKVIKSRGNGVKNVKKRFTGRKIVRTTITL